MESRIWLDVTTLLGWTRSAVGIVRVESECANYFLELNRDNIQFCQFDKLKEQYLIVSPERVGEAIERIRTKSEENESPPPSISSFRQFIKNTARGIVLSFPERMRPIVSRFGLGACSSYHALRDFLVEGKKNLRKRDNAHDARDSENLVQFQASDVYISLGLDWDQKNYTYLYSEKTKLGFKNILICYDTIPVKFPHLYLGDAKAFFARYFANLAWCADEVLCISRNSQNDLIELLSELGSPIPSTSVIKLGCEIYETEDGISSTVEEVLQEKFLLYVSTIERRKNHEILYRAYTRLVDDGNINLPLLVFVGMSGWGVGELLSDLKLDSRIRPYIRVLNHVSDGELAQLYKNAYFTVFPSLYEGWGIPVAESLAYGKFCLASDVASIPEVGGNLVEYLDPWDLPAWIERLKWYFNHPEEVEERNRLCKHEFKVPSWQVTAESILKKALEVMSL